MDDMNDPLTEFFSKPRSDFFLCNLADDASSLFAIRWEPKHFEQLSDFIGFTQRYTSLMQFLGLDYPDIDAERYFSEFPREVLRAAQKRKQPPVKVEDVHRLLEGIFPSVTIPWLSPGQHVETTVTCAETVVSRGVSGYIALFIAEDLEFDDSQEFGDHHADSLHSWSQFLGGWSPKVKLTFDPFPVDRLVEVDIADCDYEPQLSEIVGVVSPESQGGWHGSDDYKIHCFGLTAWRHVDRDELQSSLTLLRPVPEDSEHFAEFKEGEIVRMRVLLSVDGSRAIVAEVTGTNVDSPELALIASKLEQHVEIQTDRFGTLVLDRRINWFRGTVDWNGQTIQITFDAEGDLDITEQLETACSLFNDDKEWQLKIEAFAIKEKLPLGNDWRDEGVEPITEQEFLNRMQLESISIQPDRKFEFWHSDGDLFYGHSIQITGSLEKGLTHSDIPG